VFGHRRHVVAGAVQKQSQPARLPVVSVDPQRLLNVGPALRPSTPPHLPKSSRRPSKEMPEARSAPVPRTGRDRRCESPCRDRARGNSPGSRSTTPIRGSRRPKGTLLHRSLRSAGLGKGVRHGRMQHNHAGSLLVQVVRRDQVAAHGFPGSFSYSTSCCTTPGGRRSSSSTVSFGGSTFASSGAPR